MLARASELKKKVIRFFLAERSNSCARDRREGYRGLFFSFFFFLFRSSSLMRAREFLMPTAPRRAEEERVWASGIQGICLKSYIFIYRE